MKRNRAAFLKLVFEKEAAAFDKLQGFRNGIVPNFYSTCKLILQERESDDDNRDGYDPSSCDLPHLVVSETDLVLMQEVRGERVIGSGSAR